MAKSNVRQISVFLDGKQVEGTIKNIAGAFAHASNQLARMVVGSDEYLAKLQEVRQYGDALSEHRARIKGIEDANVAAAGSVNALSQEYQVAQKSLNNLEIGGVEYQQQLAKVQELESRLTEVRRQQQAQNAAVAGSIDAIQQEYQQSTKTLNTLVIDSEEYNAQLKKTQELETLLTETRKKQQAQNVAGAGSMRALEEELQRERTLLRDLVIGTKEYQDQLRKVQSLDADLQRHQQSLKGVSQGWSLARAGLDNFVGLAAGAFAVDTVIGYGKQLFNTGVQMDALAKKARTVFGDALPQITAEAEKNARSMGLTNAEYVAAAANIQDLLVPMGFQRKEAADISAQLVNLSGALSEWTGGQRSAAEVSEILNKALLGEREELKSLGISISEADVQARLADKGLDKLTGTALEQAKAMATLELVLAKSTDAQAQFADGSDSAVRRQAELTAKISEIGEKLATLLLPVFERLVDVVGGFVDVADGAVDAISGMIDPAASATKAFDEQAKKVSDLESNILPLLGRYDELKGKTNLTAAEQDELQKIITTVSSVIPTAIEGFDKYGKALGLNTDKAREFIEVEKARLKFINQQAIKETEKFVAETQRQADIVNTKLQSGKAAKSTFSPTGVGVRTDFQNLTGSEIQQLQGEAAKLQETLAGANAELARLRGDALKVPEIKTPETGGGGGGTGGGGGKDAEKEAKQLEDTLQKLIEKTATIRKDFLAKAQEDEITEAIRAVEKRYEAEIAAALELEAKGVKQAAEQRKILEITKAEEIALVTREIAEKARIELEDKQKEEEEARQEKEAQLQKEREAAIQKENDERIAFLEKQAEIKEFTDEATKTERELELQALQEHYTDLLSIAEQYGLDTTALKEAYAQKQADIEKEFAEKSAKEQQEATQARLAAMQAAFTSFGDFVTATFDLLGGEGEKAAEFQKLATLAKIAFDTAAAISSLTAASEANPTNALTFGAAGLAQFVGGLARIIANMAQAKKILSSAPQVKQKAEGRWLTVTGEKDRNRYTAEAIPPPDTGLLPHHPVLFQSQATGQPVLASERGREYFVSSKSLQDPQIANLTRMIDNITITGGRGVPQFADGGFNTTAPQSATAPTSAAAPAAPAMDMSIIARNTAVMEALLAAINDGIIAVIPDRTLTAIPERLDRINGASGGFFG